MAALILSAVSSALAEPYHSKSDGIRSKPIVNVVRFMDGPGVVKYLGIVRDT